MGQAGAVDQQARQGLPPATGADLSLIHIYSIKQYGVLVPAIARPDPEGGYELVAGHRRH